MNEHAQLRGAFAPPNSRQTTAGKTALLAQEAGLALGCDVNGQGRPHRQQAELFIKTEAGQELIPLRRGEGAQPAPYEILGPMESPSPASGSDAAAASPSGISAFIARVLDQLTLSAWLPAALLTASVAILLQFRSDRSANILTAGAIADSAQWPAAVLVSALAEGAC